MSTVRFLKVDCWSNGFTHTHKQGKQALMHCLPTTVSTLSGLALHIPIQDLLIPPSAFLTDRRKCPHIHAPYASGRRAFSVKQPLPTSAGGSPRLPRVLREATNFVITDPLIKDEGIFRISARAQTVEVLRESYDRGQKFVVWREGKAVLASSYRKEGTGDVWVEEVDQAEGFELHAAAALIKLWYKELREPIFPKSCYAVVEKFYGDSDIALEPHQLLEMLVLDADWSPISKTSKLILRMHLLPLLTRVAELQDWNHMTPDNLAVCFAPALLCGPDPIEDLKMSNIVRRILVAMIEHWEGDLAPILDTNFEKFEESLRMPESVDDREDTLEEVELKDCTETQTSGITLVDNDESDEEMGLPPLPPRPQAGTIDNCGPVGASPAHPIDGSHYNGVCPSDLFTSHVVKPANASPSNRISPVRRKPAPALLPLPRYSTIINDRPAVLRGMQYYNTVAPEVEDFNDDISLYD